MTALINFLPWLRAMKTKRAKHQLTMQKRHLENVLKTHGVCNRVAKEISWTYFNQPMKALKND